MPVHLPVMLSPYFESHHNTALHFAALHQATTIYTSLHYSYLHFTSTKFLFTFPFLCCTHFHFQPLYFPTLHCGRPNTVILSPTLFACKLILFPLSLHCTFFHLSPNLLHTSLYWDIYIYIPLPFPIYHCHFPSLVNTFLILFLKICDLPWESLITSSSSRFQSATILFTKEYFLTSVHCLLALIFHLWSTLLK